MSTDRGFENAEPTSLSLTPSRGSVTPQLADRNAQIGSLLSSALRPIRTLQIAWETLFDRLDDALTERLRGTPREELREPAANVVGSVISGLLFSQGEPDLKAMFIELLATSMTVSGASLAHPAFGELIKQMTPFEARLLTRLKKRSEVTFLVLRGLEPDEESVREQWKDVTPGMIDDEVIEACMTHGPRGAWTSRSEIVITRWDTSDPNDPLLLPSFQNFQRMHLVEYKEGMAVKHNGGYGQIAGLQRFACYLEHLRHDAKLVWIEPGIIRLSAYGRQFVSACVPEAASL